MATTTDRDRARSKKTNAQSLEVSTAGFRRRLEETKLKIVTMRLLGEDLTYPREYAACLERLDVLKRLITKREANRRNYRSSSTKLRVSRRWW